MLFNSKHRISLGRHAIKLLWPLNLPQILEEMTNLLAYVGKERIQQSEIMVFIANGCLLTTILLIYNGYFKWIPQEEKSDIPPEL